jgi:hypothetical protein
MASIRGLLALTLATLAPISTGHATAAPRSPIAPVMVAVDTPSTVNGVDVACTGIGADTRAEPRWQAYGVRVEFSNARNEYLTGGAVRLRDHAGRDLLSVRCDAPWILLRLPDGAYQVEGWLPEMIAKPRSARFTTPAKAPLRVVLQFPEL